MVILAWIWGFACLCLAALSLWPWLDGWLESLDESERLLIRLPLTIGLSFGALTLWMLAAGFWRLNVWVALAFWKDRIGGLYQVVRVRPKENFTKAGTLPCSKRPRVYRLWRATPGRRRTCRKARRSRQLARFPQALREG